MKTTTRNLLICLVMVQLTAYVTSMTYLRGTGCNHRCAHCHSDGDNGLCVACYNSTHTRTGPVTAYCEGTESPIKNCMITAETDSGYNVCLECAPGYAKMKTSSFSNYDYSVFPFDANDEYSLFCAKTELSANDATAAKVRANNVQNKPNEYITFPKYCKSGYYYDPNAADQTYSLTVSPKCKALDNANAAQKGHKEIPHCIAYGQTTDHWKCMECEKGYFVDNNVKWAWKQDDTSLGTDLKSQTIKSVCLRIPEKFVGCDPRGPIVKGKYCTLCDYKLGYWSKGVPKGDMGWGTKEKRPQLCTNGDRTVGEEKPSRSNHLAFGILMILMLTWIF